LRQALRDGDWQSILDNDMVTSKDCETQGNVGWHAVHVACEKLVPSVISHGQPSTALAVINKIALACPDACCRTNSNGELPLIIMMRSMVENQYNLDEHLEQAISKVLTHLADAMPLGLDTKDAEGRILRDIANAQGHSGIQLWARTYKAFLSRYSVSKGREGDLYRTATAKVQYARDEFKDQKVCLKHMLDGDSFAAEIYARSGHLISGGDPIDGTGVIQVVGWHMPESCGHLDEFITNGSQPENTDADSDFPYILVMKPGGCSLYEACSKERLAAYDYPKIVAAFFDIVKCVQILHAAGLVHCDLKPRNVLRFEDGD
jgi:serine/threonine protein kinase